MGAVGERDEGVSRTSGEREHGETRAARRWVVLGAGTGVGKTFVAAGLAQGLRRPGGAVAAVKPVETGLAPAHGRGEGPPEGSDAELLEAAAFHVKQPRPHPLFGFVAPVTPALAARQESGRVELDAVSRWVSTLETSSGGMPGDVVVETAGGVFSPLTETDTNLELALALEPATWVLVAADRLGVLHDLGATLRAMRAEARLPDWVVLSAPAVPDASTHTNAAELERLGFGVPIIVLPRGDWTPLLRMVARSPD